MITTRRGKLSSNYSLCSTTTTTTTTTMIMSYDNNGKPRGLWMIMMMLLKYNITPPDKRLVIYGDVK